MDRSHGLWARIEELATEDVDTIDVRTVGNEIVALGVVIERLKAELHRRQAELSRRVCDADDGSDT
ncbi:MAG: hypothetical protein ACRDWD_08820 [Acidimicrobiia bacterium]